LRLYRMGRGGIVGFGLDSTTTIEGGVGILEV
jgi:hypothetical protein